MALDEYKKYRIIQDKNYISDFDELVTETKILTATERQLTSCKKKVKNMDMYQKRKIRAEKKKMIVQKFSISRN